MSDEEHSRRAIFYALDHALQRDAKEIETGDLIVGLATNILPPTHPLASLHQDLPRIRKMLFADSIELGSPPKREVPLTNSGKTALADAAQEAQRDNRYVIGPEHLLRGLLLIDDKPSGALASAGYSLAAMRRASKTSYANNPGRPAPIDQARQLRHDKILVTILLILLTTMLFGLLFSQ